MPDSSPTYVFRQVLDYPDFNLLAGQSVPRFATTTARDAALTTPTAGQWCDLAGVGLQRYSGTAWETLPDGSWGIVRTPWAVLASGLVALAANQAWYFRVPVGGTLTKIRVYVGTSSGNISVAAYANTGAGLAAAPGTRLGTSGAVACPVGAAVADVALLASTVVHPGDWLALSADNATATFGGLAGGGYGALAAGQVAAQPTAHPCPTTAAPTADNGVLLGLVGVP